MPGTKPSVCGHNSVCRLYCAIYTAVYRAATGPPYFLYGKVFRSVDTNNLAGSDMKNLRHLVQIVSDYFDLISLYKTGAPNAVKDIW